MKVYKKVKIQQYDNLRMIAARELKDQTRWTELITLNNLRHPYITSSFDENKRAKNTLLWGDLITLPIFVEQDATWTNLDDDHRYTNLYGTDIALVDGKLKITNNDIMTTTGLANLKQALTNQLKCERGNNIVHLSYGSDLYTLIGLRNDAIRALAANAYAKSAVEKDARIKKDVKVKSNIAGDRIEIHCRATATDSNDYVDLNYSIPTSV